MWITRFEKSPTELTHTCSLLWKPVTLYTLASEGSWVVIADCMAPTHRGLLWTFVDIYSKKNVFKIYLLIFWFLASPLGLGDLSSPTRDRTQAPCSVSAKSYPLDCQGIPPKFLFECRLKKKKTSSNTTKHNKIESILACKWIHFKTPIFIF